MDRVEMSSLTLRLPQEIKKRLTELARHNGVTTSAYIKFVLTRHINHELMGMSKKGYDINIHESLKHPD